MGSGGAEKDAGGGEEVVSIFCSICLEAVKNGGNRSTARLHCGHQFHLDCIGSAFNAKGIMQCPNCRKVEKGNWLYANGSHSQLEVSLDDWTHEEDFYNLGYSEMPLGVQWCPFGRLARIPTTFEEGERASNVTVQDLLGHHAILVEHPATSVATHLCPYVAYFQPFLPPSVSHVSSNIDIDAHGFYHYWNYIPMPRDLYSTNSEGTSGVHYNVWEHHPRSYSAPTAHISGADPTSISTSTRAAGLECDGEPIAGSGSSGSSSIAYYLRGRDNVHEHYEHHHSPNAHGTQLAGSQAGGLIGIGPTLPSFQEQTGLSLLPQATSLHNGVMNIENAGRNFSFQWEGDCFAPYWSSPVDGGESWRRRFWQSTGGFDANHRMMFFPQSGSNRSSGQGLLEVSHQTIPVAQMLSLM